MLNPTTMTASASGEGPFTAPITRAFVAARSSGSEK